MRKYTRRILAALLCMPLAGALLPGKMTYAANNDAQLPEPEVIVTPVEYDAAEDSMTFEISTNREDIGIAYYIGSDFGSNSTIRPNQMFNDYAKIAYDEAVSIKLQAWDNIRVWLIDKNGSRLHNTSDYAPDYSESFGMSYDGTLFNDYLIEDRENKINVVNGDASYDSNMYIKKGILHYDFESYPFEEEYEDPNIYFRMYYKTDDGYQFYCRYEGGRSSHLINESSYDILESGTYEIDTVINGQVYRAYYDYVCPDKSVGEVRDIEWSPEQPGIFTFKPCENADYLCYVTWKSGEDSDWYGNCDYEGRYLRFDLDEITITNDIGILDLSYILDSSYIKDATSFQVEMRAMSNDIEKMAHGEWVYSEFTTNPSQNPSESNPEPKPSTEPTTPAEPKPSTEPTTPTNPAEPDAKPENPTVSPDDEEDDDDGSLTVAVTGGSADSATVGKDSTIINKDNPPVRADNIVEVTKVEASPTADGSHIYLYIVLAGLSLGIFAVYMSKEKKMN